MKKSIEHTFTVPGDRPVMPSIYNPVTWPVPVGGGEYFSLWVPREKVEYLIEPPKPNIFPSIQIRSRIRPEVIPGNKSVDLLVKELARLDARNLPRDKIFEGEPLLVTVLNYEYDCRGNQGTAVSLVSVEFYKGC